MDAIVSGKVEKPEGSLGVFKSLFQEDLSTKEKPEFFIEIPSTFATDTRKYYIKFNSKTNTILYIYNLYRCRTQSTGSYVIAETGGMNFGIWINFTYFIKQNKIGISTGQRYEYVNSYIESIEIGTLE